MDGLPQNFGDLGALPDLGGMGGGFGDMGDDISTGLPDFGLSTPRPPQKLSKKAKAAIIVRLLASKDVTLPLSNFTEEMQVQLAHQMSELRLIDKTTLTLVIEEFIEELESIGLTFPGGLEGALNVLDGTISNATAAKMRKNAGFSLSGDPWERLGELDAERLLPILEEESVEIGAVLLSKLNVSKSAQLLSKLPGERARRIAYAISLTSAVEPDVVQRIGVSIASQIDAQPAQAFSDAPTERVGAILNYSASSTREGVLEGLDETDKHFAQEVRKNIFTYANIATRIDGRDISKLVREVDQATLLKALAGATGISAVATDFILANMSKRMADGLREEISVAGTIKEADAEDAMTAVVAAVRRLEDAGDIFFLTEEEG
jgi:flagellar motor switch protein FliG